MFEFDDSRRGRNVKERLWPLDLTAAAWKFRVMLCAGRKFRPIINGPQDWNLFFRWTVS